MQYYKLDPCHYFTSPGLSWDAMLKMTNIKLELMTDIDMFQFIEKGMRAGNQYGNQYGNANNKYMKEYNEKAPSKYIMYLDANNLYDWAMSQYLPTGNFKWMTDKEISKIDLRKYKADDKKGLILEVDLEYPQELHDITNQYGNANNKYMKEYNEKAPSKYIMYLDANNLYGWAMSQYLPTGNFKWMTDKEISKIDLRKYKADDKKGLILEVDLEYPQEQHDIHNDYPG